MLPGTECDGRADVTAAVAFSSSQDGSTEFGYRLKAPVLATLTTRCEALDAFNKYPARLRRTNPRAQSALSNHAANTYIYGAGLNQLWR